MNKQFAVLYAYRNDVYGERSLGIEGFYDTEDEAINAAVLFLTENEGTGTSDEYQEQIRMESDLHDNYLYAGGEYWSIQIVNQSAGYRGGVVATRI